MSSESRNNIDSVKRLTITRDNECFYFDLAQQQFALEIIIRIKTKSTLFSLFRLGKTCKICNVDDAMQISLSFTKVV